MNADFSINSLNYRRLFEAVADQMLALVFGVCLQNQDQLPIGLKDEWKFGKNLPSLVIVLVLGGLLAALIYFCVSAYTSRNAPDDDPLPAILAQQQSAAAPQKSIAPETGYWGESHDGPKRTVD
jgi:hypothetical protein